MSVQQIGTSYAFQYISSLSSEQRKLIPAFNSIPQTKKIMGQVIEGVAAIHELGFEKQMREVVAEVINEQMTVTTFIQLFSKKADEDEGNFRERVIREVEVRLKEGKIVRATF